jgi:hypothetical protein
MQTTIQVMYQLERGFSSYERYTWDFAYASVAFAHNYYY